MASGSLGTFAARWTLSRCLGRGLGIGVGYALLQVIAEIYLEDFSARYGMSLITAIVLSISMGGVGGVIAGLLLPRVRGVFTAIVAGTLVMLPATLAFALASGSVTRERVLTASDAALVIGAIGGFAISARYGTTG